MPRGSYSVGKTPYVVGRGRVVRGGESRGGKELKWEEGEGGMYHTSPAVRKCWDFLICLCQSGLAFCVSCFLVWWK
jgi:hypothetical protein